MPRPTGMKAFTVVWFGQVFSLLGSGMSGFAMGIWAWQTTQSATAMALMGFFSFVPVILFSPIAGALVDRWNRKLVMMLSDIATGVTTIFILIMYLSGDLQIWHLYVAGAFAGIFQSFQWPAYSAAITLMVPKEHYTRASGMISLAESGSGILAPIFAGALIATTGLSMILVIDLITLTIAITALLIVIIPQPARSEEGAEGQGNLAKESMYGFRFILARPSLLGLQLVFMFGNLMSSLGFTLMAPMILARSVNNANFLAWTESAGGIGGVLGGLIISAWGGPKKRVYGVLIGWIICGVLMTGLGVSRGLIGWIAFSFLMALFNPLINSSNQAIWMAKVAPDVQGRVFSVRRMIAQVAGPLGMLIAGPLADQFMEPGMKTPSATLAPALGWITGTGPGTGMSLILAFSGLAIVIIGLTGLSISKIRNVETIMPDYEVKIETPN